MKEKIILIQKQKEQVSALIRETYDFGYKGGRVFLNGANFAHQCPARSGKDLERQAFRLIRDTRQRLCPAKRIQAARRSLQTDE